MAGIDRHRSAEPGGFSVRRHLRVQPGGVLSGAGVLPGDPRTHRIAMRIDEDMGVDLRGETDTDDARGIDGVSKMRQRSQDTIEPVLWRLFGHAGRRAVGGVRMLEAGQWRARAVDQCRLGRRCSDIDANQAEIHARSPSNPACRPAGSPYSALKHKENNRRLSRRRE